MDTLDAIYSHIKKELLTRKYKYEYEPILRVINYDAKIYKSARLTNRLAVYNGEFDDYANLERIANNFIGEINNEVSQAINEVLLNILKKDKEYIKPLPPLDLLFPYVYREKEYEVTKESMINYKGKKYSVTTKYICLKVNIIEASDGNISIYYNQDFIVCHSLIDKKYNYKTGHMHEILKSDTCKHLSDDQIDDFIKENILFYGTPGVGNYRKSLFIERLLTKPHSNNIFIKKTFDNN